MPLTHDIGVRIPYPLLKTDNFGCLFFLFLYTCPTTPRKERISPEHSPPQGYGGSQAINFNPQTTTLQTQKKG